MSQVRNSDKAGMLLCNGRSYLWNELLEEKQAVSQDIVYPSLG